MALDVGVLDVRVAAGLAQAALVEGEDPVARVEELLELRRVGGARAAPAVAVQQHRDLVAVLGARGTEERVADLHRRGGPRIRHAHEAAVVHLRLVGVRGAVVTAVVVSLVRSLRRLRGVRRPDRSGERAGEGQRDQGDSSVHRRVNEPPAARSRRPVPRAQRQGRSRSCWSPSRSPGPKPSWPTYSAFISSPTSSTWSRPSTWPSSWARISSSARPSPCRSIRS